MKRKYVFLVCVIFVAILSLSFLTSCSQIQKSMEAPSGLRIEDGILYWNYVSNASQYVICIDGNDGNKIEDCNSYDLTKDTRCVPGNEYEIKVKAFSGALLNLSSDYSDPITYLAIEPKVDDDNSQDIEETGTQVTEEKRKDYLSNKNSKYYGIGRTINIITTDENYMVSGTEKVFDDDKLSQFDLIENFIGQTKAQTISATSMADFYANVNVEYNKKIKAGAKIEGIFTASAERGFSFAVGADYKNTTEEILVSSYQNYISKSLALDGRNNTAKFSKALSEEVLRDAKNLEPNEFIAKYGTHIILAAYFGGRLESNYYLANRSTTWNAQLAFNYMNEAKLAIEELGEAGNSSNFSIKAKLGAEKENLEERFNIYGIGGDTLQATSLKEFYEDYGRWVESVNGREIENSAMIDFPQKSLVAIWDLFPEEYSQESKKLSECFAEMAESAKSDFMDKYKREYLVDKGDTTNYAGGSGTIESPYLISDASHLRNINLNLDAYYKIISDIDLENVDWTPIGFMNGNYEKFTGVIDGGFHIIRNLGRTSQPVYESGNVACQGLFGYIKDATIKNLRIEDLKIDCYVESRQPSYMLIGGIAGKAENCMINNCSVKGIIKAVDNENNEQFEYIGGLVGEGFKSLTIDHSMSDVNITAKHVVVVAGGLIGNVGQGNDVKVTNSYSLGNISLRGKWWWGGVSVMGGGIIGRVEDNVYATVRHCYYYGKMDTDARGFFQHWSELGGMIGHAKHSTHNSTVINNVYCMQEKIGNEEYKKHEREIWETNKKGNQISVDTLKSGKEITQLPSYSESKFKASEDSCWVYEAGKLPRLYWE